VKVWTASNSVYDLSYINLIKNLSRYGDYVPAASSGKLLGAIGVLLGILVVSLPVPIIQNKVSELFP
jgi:hypothetical protein